MWRSTSYSFATSVKFPVCVWHCVYIRLLGCEGWGGTSIVCSSSIISSLGVCKHHNAYSLCSIRYGRLFSIVLRRGSQPEWALTSRRRCGLQLALWSLHVDIKRCRLPTCFALLSGAWASTPFAGQWQCINA